MAKEVIVRHTDDLDGTEATHSNVLFSFEGTEYSIDLSSDHYAEMKADFARYSDHATRVTSRGRGRSASASPASAGSSKEKSAELQAVRAWAADNGIELNQRGRIKQTILAAYREDDPSLVKNAS